MWVVLVLISLLLIAVLLVDSFEAMVLPRRVPRTIRPTRIFIRTTWMCWRLIAFALPAGKRRQNFLSIFGPLSMLSLLTSWCLGLIFCFALLEWSLGTPLRIPDKEPATFVIYLYLSAVTFFTLGFGEVTAANLDGRFLTVVEAGLGFGFLAVIIGYLPVLYQAFSKAEVTISMLDARAGSPPTAGQLLARLGQARSIFAVQSFLAEWERWAAELLESHLSFPVLCYYRSQHDNQSWLSTLTAILDTSAMLLTVVKDADRYFAQLTFAMARHAAVDLSLVFNTPPADPNPNRLPPEAFADLMGQLRKAGLSVIDDPKAMANLAALRQLYEPFLTGLAAYFLFNIPPFYPERAMVDNWQTSAWTRRTAGIGKLEEAAPLDEHFD